MKKLGAISMIVSVISTLNSTLFTIIHTKHSAIVIISFWGLLSLLEVLFVWILLFSKPQNAQYLQKVAIISLVIFAVIWIIVVLPNPSRNSIFLWALNTLSFSILFFAGLIIYHKEMKT